MNKEIKMKILYNSIFPFKGYVAINIFGILFARREYNPVSATTINHESIHSAQMRELLYVGFYIVYFLEWLYRLITPPWKSAYMDISFEKEAYSHEREANYLRTRKHFAQWRK